MPKGIPAAKPKSTLDRIAKNLVLPGLKILPGSESTEFPQGIPLPDGVRVRTDRGVEIRFYQEGRRMSETVRGRPTVAFLMEVARKRDRIQQLIGLAKFGDAEYLEEFPDSPRFQKRQDVTEEAVMTVGQALDDWFSSRAGTVGQNTERDYELAIRNQLKPFKFNESTINLADFVSFTRDVQFNEKLTLERHLGGPARQVNPHDHHVLGQLPVALLTDVIINAIRKQILAEGLSIKRVKNLMAPLKGAVTRQVKLKKLAINPFDLVEPLQDCSAPKVRDDSPRSMDSLDAPLPGDDIASFLSAEGDPDPFSAEEIMAIIGQLEAAMANQMTFAFWAGLRTGEVIALRACDLQLSQNRIMVRRSLSRGVLKSPKTGKERWVNLVPPAKIALEAQLALLKAPDGWVFPNPFTKQRWKNESKITRRWTAALARAGIRYRRPYQTRHTFASMMLSAGENIMYVAQQMGHADWSMLVKVYGHWMPSGGLQAAGSLVAAAHASHWPKLLDLLSSRPVENPNSDSEDDDTDLEAECCECVENSA